MNPKLRLFTLGVLGMMLFSCQSEESLMPDENLDKEVNMEELKKHPYEMKLISDEIFTEENQPVETRSFATSVPIYRYYGNDRHYYGETYLGSNCNIHGTPYRFENEDFRIESVSSSLTHPLYRYYVPETNDHILSTSPRNGSTLMGYIFKEPQLGTVPLMEYYCHSLNEYIYVVRQSEFAWWRKANISSSYIRTLGYVYLGDWIDDTKEPITISISKIQSIPCKVTLVINAYVATQNRRQTLEVYLPSYTNGWSGGYAAVTLHNTWAISSIEMTVETYDHIYPHHAFNSNRFILNATETIPGSARVNDDLMINVTPKTKEKGLYTDISISYR